MRPQRGRQRCFLRRTGERVPLFAGLFCDAPAEDRFCGALLTDGRLTGSADRRSVEAVRACCEDEGRPDA